MSRVELSDVVTTSGGKARPGVKVNITVHAGSAGSNSLWESETGANTYASLVTDSKGRFSVWLDEGRYDVQPEGSPIQVRELSPNAKVEEALNLAQEALAAAGASTGGGSSTSSTATGVASLENGERPIAANGEQAQLGENPVYGVVSGDGRHIYTTNTKSKSISVSERFGRTGLALVGTISTGAGSEPKGIAITPDGSTVFVADYAEKKIQWYKRNKYTGELTLGGTVNLNAAASKAIHLCVSPEGTHLYVVAEEAAGAEKPGIFQFEIQATGEPKALVPERVAGTELGFCNWVAISPDGNSVYVGYASGIRLLSRVKATGILTNVGLQESSGAIGSVVVSPDNETVYSACGGANTLDEHSRNTGTGVLTKKGTKAVTKAISVAITPDGRTVLVTSSTLNEVFGFQRSKPEAAWILTAFATPSVATGVKPMRVLINPDGINVYILNETDKTLTGYSRTVQVKVETPYIRLEGGLTLNEQDANTLGKLRPIKRVDQISFYISSTEPSDTGKILWTLPVEGPTSSSVEQAMNLAYLATITKEQDWAGNVRPYNKGVLRYDMTTAAPIAEPLQKKLKEGLQEGSREKESDPLSAAKIAKLTLLTGYALEDYGSPGIVGKSSDPEYTVKDEFTKQEKVHIPTTALTARAEGDHDLTIIDLPSGRILNLGGPTFNVAGNVITLTGGGLSCHDMNGPAYSTNSKEQPGGEVQMSGAAIVGASSTQETGGSSSARIEKFGLTIRARQVVEADTNPFGLPPMMMRGTIRQKEVAISGSGTAPRGTTLYANGVVVSPTDNRAPYVGPLAHQGEVSANGSTNLYAAPMGAMMRLNWAQEFIEQLNCPNWAKWIYFSLKYRGLVIVDVKGPPAGFEICRFESLRSYSHRGDPYYTNWLEKRAKSDGSFCVQGEEHGFKTWRLDPTGNGTISHASIFAALEFIKPPASPAGFPN